MPSQSTRIVPGITRLRAENPSPMTGTGTNTYILHGPDGAVVIDPGPALPAHLAAILAALGPAPLAAILVSHAHLDHSALAPALARATGAPVLAFGAATAGRSATMRRLAESGLSGGGEGVDADFVPDRCLQDGETLALAGLAIEVIHTPGHMGGHLSFALGEIAFTADHAMGWATSLVSPPDGDMAAYMASLGRLAARPWSMLLPGHGDAVDDPAARLAWLCDHRRDREAAIRAELSRAPQTPAELTRRIYTDTPETLLPAATRNILAHLIDLHERKLVITDTPFAATTRYRPI